MLQQRGDDEPQQHVNALATLGRVWEKRLQSRAQLLCIVLPGDTEPAG